MKISEVTQKSHIEQLAEDRSKLDEAIWAPVTAAVGGAASIYSLGSRFGWNPFEWTEEQRTQAYKEIGADVALGATGLGLVSLLNKARKIGSGVRATRRAAASAQKKADKAMDKATDPNVQLSPSKQAKLTQKAADLEAKAAEKAAAAAAARVNNLPTSTGEKAWNTAKKATAAYGYGAAGNIASNLATGKPLVSTGDVDSALGLDDAGKADKTNKTNKTNNTKKTLKFDRSRSKGGGFEKLRMPKKGSPLG